MGELLFFHFIPPSTFSMKKFPIFINPKKYFKGLEKYDINFQFCSCMLELSKVCAYIYIFPAMQGIYLRRKISGHSEFPKDDTKVKSTIQMNLH